MAAVISGPSSPDRTAPLQDGAVSADRRWRWPVGSPLQPRGPAPGGPPEVFIAHAGRLQLLANRLVNQPALLNPEATPFPLTIRRPGPVSLCRASQQAQSAAWRDLESLSPLKVLHGMLSGDRKNFALLDRETLQEARGRVLRPDLQFPGTRHARCCE